MKEHIWRIDNETTIKLEVKVFSKKRFLVNDQEVKSYSLVPKESSFSLPDGRNVEFKRVHQMFSHSFELKVDDELYVSNDEFESSNCKSCNTPSQPNEKFCTNCGSKLLEADFHKDSSTVKQASTTIMVVGFFFILGGIGFFMMNLETYNAAMKNLAQYKDTDIFPNTLSGVQVTVSQLRQQVQVEHYSMLILNFILAAIMFILSFWSKKKPLAALLVATSVYLMVQVASFIHNPETLMQGFIMKILIIGLFARGIKAALKLRSNRQAFNDQVSEV